MKHVEPVAMIAAEEVEGDDADDVEEFEDERACDRADHAQRNRRFERENRRGEKRHGFDGVASILDVDRKRAAANDRAARRDWLSDAAKNRARDSSQRARERRDGHCFDRRNCNGNVKNDAKEREADQKADLTAIQRHTRRIVAVRKSRHGSQCTSGGSLRRLSPRSSSSFRSLPMISAMFARKQARASSARF